MFRDRLLTPKLKKLLSHFPCVVISGARQVGKSTLLKHLFPKSKDFVTFDPVTDVENARSDPELFLNNHKTPLILDEIQYAPELIPSLKRRIDRNRQPGQYILTGSQQWQVMTRIAESLAGRAVFLDLRSFCLKEIVFKRLDSKKNWLTRWLENPKKFVKNPNRRIPSPPLYEMLWRGFLPEAAFLDLELISDFYSAYKRTYIERDVRLMGEISDWQQFGRFLQLVAALTSQEINYSQLGRDIQVTPQTANRWLSVLTATFQWIEIPAFSENSVKRISKKTKGYISDTGLACFLNSISSPQALGGHPLAGSLFETAVVQELIKLIDLLPFKPKLYHWRANGGAEVDFILEIDQRFYPMEIKLTTQPSRRHTSGISAFRKAYSNLNIQPGLVIAPCENFFQLSEKDFSIPWDSQ